MVLLATEVTINWQETIFAVIGGLGIFLYGINLMGESLKALAGNKLKLIIEKSTNTPIKGILVGIIITGLIQSSSGTTALTIGLVRAGLMTLPQAIGIILGANIGTTITSFLLGLKIKAYALPIMAVGSFLIFFMKRRKFRDFGRVLLGFGMLFYGLKVMGGSLSQLALLPEFKAALEAVADIPVLGLLVGAVTTAVIQSSSATIGILQGLYATGSIPLIGAIAIVFGNNIGTTITAVLASIGGSIAAKRTALVHVLFNVLGSIVIFIFIVPYHRFIAYLEVVVLNSSNPEMTISFAHMGFNLLNTFIFFWLINQLVWLVTKLIRGDEGLISVNVDTLQEDLVLESPILALESAKIVVNNMGKVAQKMLETTIKFSFTNTPKFIEEAMQYEEMLDTIDKKAHDYLVRIATHDLDSKASSLQAEYVDTIRDFERIGDHCTNLVQFFEDRYEKKVVAHVDEHTELDKLYSVLSDTMTLTLEAFESDDKEKANLVKEFESVIDKLVIKNRKRHIMRLNNKEIPQNEDSLYVDILSNIERIGDHCNNIAVNIIQENYYNEEINFEYNPVK
ncbi:MAG: Na/Pi cotransporter family protein [Candidatus Izimaplasma sp.]|nr:Na/Pi cotransporter family protein [Candidatus Izimaplasma bacterium]